MSTGETPERPELLLSDAELGTAAVATTAPDAPGRRIAPKTATAVAYMTATFLAVMDNQIVNVALPTLTRQFHAAVSSVQWTVIAYSLSLAVWIPASGWIGDRFGTKRTFIVAIGLFTVASALCGQARNLPELIASRALQGAGGGMITPVAMSMLWRAYPPKERARLQQLTIIPILLAPAAAPILGGALIDNLSWRWVFYVNIPVGFGAVLFSLRYLSEHAERADSRFDLPGFVLSGGGLALVLYAISQGSTLGWGAPPILITGIIGAALLVAFTRAELRTDDPILKVGLLSERLFRATNTVSVLTSGGVLGITYLAPIYLQVALGRSAVAAGLTTFVQAFGVLLGTQTIGRLYRRVGPRVLCTAGLGGLTVICVLLAGVSGGTNVWIIRALIFFGGVTASTAILPTQTAMFANVASSDTGHAAAITNTARQAALAFGVAIVTTVVQAGGGHSVAAFQRGFFASAVLAAIGALTAFFAIHTSDAHSTMHVRVKQGSDAVAPAEVDSA